MLYSNKLHKSLDKLPLTIIVLGASTLVFVAFVQQQQHPFSIASLTYITLFCTAIFFGRAVKSKTKYVEVKNYKEVIKGHHGAKKYVRIVYGTTTNTAKTLADELFQYLSTSLDAEVDVVNLKEYDPDNLEQEDYFIVIMPTWTGGEPPNSAKPFFTTLHEFVNDFRVDKSRFLRKMKYAVLGLGNNDYNENYCKAARDIDDLIHHLGASSILDIELFSDSKENQVPWKIWKEKVYNTISGEKLVKNFKEEMKRKSDCTEAHDQEMEIEDIINESYLKEENTPGQPIGDMEDMVKAPALNGQPQEMLTKMQRKALVKEGYKVIGTHSAVKLCRWTKHQLRGRGGCYKHTFYGITSYQCMEATPSLACANKCVFCWRHHKNPVGKEWRWKMDKPDMIVEQAIDQHRKMIKTMKGVPGVVPERFTEAFNVKHCALSLVGEPIMYPEINTLVRELHEREISTFLVTNAQFPHAIKALDPVTQLYVSVDAATKDSLNAIDRPLFSDFWERFQDSLLSLKQKGQRTVYRLTLVKKWNMEEDEEELDSYAKLVELGEPDLIEIKAVTYCGKSDASSLTMENVPWHEEVRKFAMALCGRTKGQYGCACEHVHSCCTLLAKKSKFFKNETWHTWIDYPKFHALMRRYYETDGNAKFGSEDYVAPTPAWALWGAKEEGFDPAETRFKRAKKKTK